MTGFSFGQSGQNTAVVNPLNTGNGFSLGGPAQTTTISGTGQAFSLGQASGASTGFSLGPSSGASTGFSFGQTSGPSTGFSLGQTAGASTGFSLGQTAGPSTGFPLGQTSGPSTGFPLGQTSGVSTGFSLGQTSGAPTGFPLGKTSTVSTGFPLGQTSSVPTGIFGQSPASTAGLFGQSSTAATSTGLNFGFPSNSSGSSLAGLGTPNAATTSSAGYGGLFGQTNLASSTSGGFGTGSLLGTTSTTSVAGSGLFGLTNPNSSSTTSILQATPISSIGGFFGTSIASPSTSGNLFGQTSTVQLSQAPSSGLFNPASTSSGFNLNLSGQVSAPSLTPSLGLGGSLPLATTSVAGLGGFQPAAIDTGVGSGTSKNDGKCVKETPLPQDIFNSMIIFENYKDTEKKASEENIRQTAAPFHKLIDDTKKLRQHVVQLSNQHAQLHASARKLKSSVIQEAESVEMARRTQDTPMGLQGDNKSPEQFFLRLVRSFEDRMTYCRNKIDEVEKCSQTNGGLSKITSEDMKEVLKKEHEMVKVLAAKVYTLHNQLINHCCKSNDLSLPQPEALFKPASSLNESIGISHKDSSVLRPCLGEGGSGLLNFQSGQQRAKAVSLGAAPPTLPLGQHASSGILGSTSQSGLFGPSSSFPFNNSSLNFGAGNNQSSSSAFGSPSANVSGGFFGNTSLGNSSVGAFGLGNTSAFAPKAFGKSSSDHDESQRKRRM